MRRAAATAGTVGHDRYPGPAGSYTDPDAEAADPETITRKLSAELRKIAKATSDQAGARLAELLKEMRELLH